MKDMQSTFKMKLSMLDARIEIAKETIATCGHGRITMTGSPPERDDVAQTLYKDWMKQRWSKLFNYKSGGFSIVVDAQLTPAQKAASEQMTELVDQADKLKVDHQSKIQPVHDECERFKAKLPALKRAEEIAHQQYEKAQRIGEQPSWHEFKHQYPNEYAQIKLMYQVNTYIGRAANWIGTVDSDLQTLESLVGELAQ